MSQISKFRVLTIKDLTTLLECSETKAKAIKKDIQEHYKIKFVMFLHFERYFKTNID